MMEDLPVSFSDTLGSLAKRIEGAVAAIILGIDGIPIERYTTTLEPGLDIEMIATELTTLLRRGMHTATDTALGDLREMVIGTERLTILLRPITPDYFLMLAVLPGGNVGRARYELRKAQLVLEEEFAI
jgi:predicted regulator of Ras-like GTPase activity (Roadblock/LC7/MglB family)